MRTKQALALLAEQERKFDRERALWHDERERLLDRIMHLADRPMPDPYEKPPLRVSTDVVDADSTLGDDLYLPSVMPSDLDDISGYGDYSSAVSTALSMGHNLSPRERMLRSDD